MSWVVTLLLFGLALATALYALHLVNNLNRSVHVESSCTAAADRALVDNLRTMVLALDKRITELAHDVTALDRRVTEFVDLLLPVPAGAGPEGEGDADSPAAAVDGDDKCADGGVCPIGGACGVVEELSEVDTSVRAID